MTTAHFGSQTIAERKKEEMNKEKDKDDLSQHFNMLRCGVVKSGSSSSTVGEGFSHL